MRSSLDQSSRTSASKDLQRLIVEHPWLERSYEQHQYLSPAYYDKLLKPYVFSNKDDLDIYRDFLIRTVAAKRNLDCVELGCGTGRSTVVLLEVLQEPSSLDLVDLSDEMISHVKKRFAKARFVRTVKMDHLDFIKTCDREYDLVASLWSYSHSVHEHIFASGLRAAEGRLRSALPRFFRECLKPGGCAFIIHMDAGSVEQRILLRQWRRLYPVLREFPGQTPSKIITDQILEECKQAGVLSFKCRHLVGDPIHYATMEEALETFFNFHMESRFNRHRDLKVILEDVRKAIKSHQGPHGYEIRHGCFVYEIQRGES